QTLGMFMDRMREHLYENPRVEDVVGMKDDFAYVRTNIEWTSLNPVAKKVKLEPGQTLKQEVAMIETWRFVDGDWMYVKPQNDREFFEAHPELLRQEGD